MKIIMALPKFNVTQAESPKQAYETTFGKSLSSLSSVTVKKLCPMATLHSRKGVVRNLLNIREMQVTNFARTHRNRRGTTMNMMFSTIAVAIPEIRRFVCDMLTSRRRARATAAADKTST